MFFKGKLALRYLRAHFRRYVFLFLALGFGFAVITVMTSLSRGMKQNVQGSAEYHYGGHLFVQGFDKDADTMIRVDDPEAVSRAVEAAGLSSYKKVKRTNLFMRGVLYFNGKAVRQKNVFGVDWEDEKEILSPFLSGGTDLGPDDIIISAPVAEELGARQGDMVVLEVETLTGQRNTKSFVIESISRDESIFGYYKCFVQRQTLNKLLGMGIDEYSSLGLYFRRLGRIEDYGKQLRRELEKRLPAAPAIEEKGDLDRELSKSWRGVRYFVIPLSVYVSQVADLLTAMKLLSYFLFVMMVLIVLGAVVVTYKLVLRERAGETAAMRALGMREGEILRVLLLEGTGLTLLSVAAGFLLSLLVLFVISRLSFDWVPGFEIFMSGGRLVPSFSVIDFFLTVGIIFITLVTAVFLPAQKDLSGNLAVALAEET